MRFLRAFACLLFLTGNSFAITIPWSTSYDCSPWTAPTNPTCPAGATYASSATACGQNSSMSAAANNPLGTGLGYRMYIAGGNSQTEYLRWPITGTYDNGVWLRYYHRVQSGTNMNGYSDYKVLYVNYGSSTPILVEFNGFGARLISNGWERYRWNFSWSTLYPGGISDGTWNCYEFYFNRTANEARFWLNGTERTVVQQDAARGVGSFAGEIRGPRVNEHGNPSPACPYEDIDDIVISTSGYIGPIGGGPPADNTAPTVPTNLSATAASSSQIDLTWTASTDDTAVTGYNIRRGGALINQSATNSYSDTGLSANTNYTYTVDAYDAAGNTSAQSASDNATTQGTQTGTILLEEYFNDANFTARGWDDTTTPAGTIESGTFRCAFITSGTGCSGGRPGRHLLASDSDEIYMTFNLKLSSDFVGSHQTYHPHIFHLLSDQDAQYAGMAGNHLNVYVELGTPYYSGNQNIYPLFNLQDSLHINQSYTQGQNLTAITESRAIGGCNGNSDGHTNTGTTTQECYANPGPWGSGQFYGNKWYVPPVGTPGAIITKNVWHNMAAHIKLNTVNGGIGQADGILKMWVDGVPVYDHSDLILRTGANPTIKFRRLAILPYISGNSPVAQSFWIDNLVITSQLTAPADTVPNAFSFTDNTGVALSASVVSAPITVAGIDNTTNISTSGSGCGYKVNAGACTSGAGTVAVGDSVSQCGTASDQYGTVYPSCTLTIGGVTDSNAPWTATTVGSPPPEAPSGLRVVTSPGTSLGGGVTAR